MLNVCEIHSIPLKHKHVVAVIEDVNLVHCLDCAEPLDGVCMHKD